MTYISSATGPCTRAELQQLATISAGHNRRDAITGALLYKDGSFLQVLEGGEAAVRGTFARIGCDIRHRGLIVLLQGAIHERQFPDWSMRVEIIAAAQSAAEPPGEFVNALRARSRLPTPLTPTQTLLMTFSGWSRHAVELARTREIGALAAPGDRRRRG
jgi:hypothetical protein